MYLNMIDKTNTALEYGSIRRKSKLFLGKLMVVFIHIKSSNHIYDKTIASFNSQVKKNPKQSSIKTHNEINDIHYYRYHSVKE